jgi:hypothetical protein
MTPDIQNVPLTYIIFMKFAQSKAPFFHSYANPMVNKNRKKYIDIKLSIGNELKPKTQGNK